MMGKKFWSILLLLVLLAGGGFYAWHRHAISASEGGRDVQDLSNLYVAEEETNAAVSRFRKDPEAKKARIIRPLSDTEKHVYLYFDGLPDRAMTEEILKVLDRKDAKAAFFVEGQNAGDSPETMKEIVKHKQVIGNYTWLGRPSFEKLDEEKAIRSLVRTQKAVDVLTGRSPSFFRAPRTEYTDTLLEEAGAAGLSYAVLSNVTVSRGEMSDEAAAEKLAAGVKNGSLVAFEINKPLDIRARETGKSDERPAIDMKPTIRDGDYREKTEKKDHTAEEVERLITALENEGFGLYSLDSDVLLSSLK